MNQQLPIESLRINYAVGIDPDIDRSGLAVWSRTQQRLTFVEAVPFWVLLEKVSQVKVGEAIFYVDAGWLNEGYHHYAGLPDNFSDWSEKSKMAYMVKCGVQLGKNFGVGQLIVGYLRAIGHSVKEVRPVTGKWSAADLKRYTGWAKRSNSEARDAAKLCFQR